MELDHLNPEVHHDNLQFQQTMLDQICGVSHNTPVMCHKYACKKQQHREQYFMDRQLACRQFSKFGGNMHSSEFYISLNSRTPLALLLFQNGEKEVIVNQIIIFNLSFLSFLIQHSTSL